MPATLPRIDQDVLAGIRIGDERSLERLFRESFQPLTEEAAAQVEDRTCAPRVVENAFRRVWEERASFATPESLERFLHSAINDSAARENKRLASLHRFEAGAHVRVPAHKKHEPTVDEAWSHLSASLHAADSPEAHAAARAQASHLYKHDAVEHVASIGKRRWGLGAIAVGAAVTLAVVAPLWWAERSSADAAATRALASPDARVVSTVTGQQASVTLLDESKATLGPDSKLVIAPDFGSTVRAMKLEGAAMFTVAPGNRHPFQVRTGNASITANGTTFGVRAYPDDPVVTIGVREGEVVVKAGGEGHSVGAGRVVTVTKGGELRPLGATAMDDAFGWAGGGPVVISSRPLRQALPELQRWFALDLKVRDSTLLNRQVSASAKLESPRDAIAAVERSGKLKFDYEGTTMVLRDAGAAPAENKPTPNRTTRNKRRR
jgi:transmembrane sensor